MLIMTIQKRDKWTIVITSGLTLGILLILTGFTISHLVGLGIYTISGLLFIIYTYRSKELPNLERIIIGITGTWVIITCIYKVLHYAYADVIQVLTIIPVICYFILLQRGLIKRKEFGFLTIVNVEFIITILRIWI